MIQAQEKYVVYRLNEVMNSDKHLALEEISFKNWRITNSFDSEKEAIQALIEDEKIYCHYIILKQVYITN
jgi:hypothetical protein